MALILLIDTIVILILHPQRNRIKKATCCVRDVCLWLRYKGNKLHVKHKYKVWVLAFLGSVSSYYAAKIPRFVSRNIKEIFQWFEKLFTFNYNSCFCFNCTSWYIALRYLHFGITLFWIRIFAVGLTVEISKIYMISNIYFNILYIRKHLSCIMSSMNGLYQPPSIIIDICFVSLLFLCIPAVCSYFH